MKEIDIEGESTLKSIAKAENFNYWMYQQMATYLKGNVLEIGSGIGNISKFIRTDGQVVLSDVRDQYVSQLKTQFPDYQTVNMDLVHPDFVHEYAEFIGKFDFVFALNVVEHIENDQLALQNMQKLLKKNGVSFVLVPAYQSLYNEFDRSLEHFRRYTKSSLIKAFPTEKNVMKSWYFNSLGIVGWFVVGKIMSKEIIPESNMSLYNKLVPLVKFLDFITMNKVGLSVIVAYQNK